MKPISHVLGEGGIGKFDHETWAMLEKHGAVTYSWVPKDFGWGDMVNWASSRMGLEKSDFEGNKEIKIVVDL